MPARAAVETFPALDALPGIRAAFLTRLPGIDVLADRDTALARLRPAHDALIADLGFAAPAFAEQIHGDLVTIVNGPAFAPGADGLATNVPGVTLGIYVADCAAIYLVDPRRRAIALAHSGRKGTAANILAAAVASLRENFSSTPADLVVVVSPCIRPPHYEIDFAATIAAQAHAAGIDVHGSAGIGVHGSMGVGTFHDAGTDTAAHPDRYYSYRREQGKTGRMLALLAIDA